MNSLRNMVAMGAVAALLATAIPEFSGTAEAGMPAPLPTQIPIRDVSAPPASNTPAYFVPKRATKKYRRAKPTKKRSTARSAPRAAKEAPAPVGATTAAPKSSGPKLEQRYEAPTESLFLPEPETTGKGATPKATAGQKPSPIEFPPEPAAAAAPKAASTPAPAPAPTPATANAPVKP
jgi:hypothetical protein